MALAHSPKIITDGLVLALDAGNTKSYPGSGTTWTDLSGNGNTGTLVNGVGFDGGNGGSLSFDGVNDYITLGENSFISTDFTYEVWFDLTATTKERYLISLGYDNASSFLCFVIDREQQQNAINFIFRDSNNVNTTYYWNSNLSSGTKYHLCLTRSGSSNIAYLNGVQAFTFTDGTPIGENLKYEIGWATDRNKTTAYHEGNIYETRLYNRALTASEIQQNFNALRGRFGI